MPAHATLAAEHRLPSRQYVRHPLLAVVRPSVLAVIAVLLFMGFAHDLQPSFQFLHLRLIEALVLMMYFWQFARHSPSFMEAAGIGLISAGFLFLVLKAALVPVALILLMTLAWLIITWLAKGWPLLRGLTAVAVFALVLQAAMMLLEPLRGSGAGIFVRTITSHLILGLLLFIAFASSRTWHEEKLRIPQSRQSGLKISSALLLLAIFVQLGFGDVFRQLQPGELTVTDVITTQGRFFPTSLSHDLLLLHLHKYWGCLVAVLVMIVAWKARLWFGNAPRLRWIPPALLIMPINQVVLGIYVILTGKSYWVTQFHVLNGYMIFILGFLLTASVWGATLGIGLQGEQDTAGKAASAV